jgi:hypothetical protein
MQNRIVQIDRVHSRAISRAIGERLRVSLSHNQSELPASIRTGFANWMTCPLLIESWST